MRNLPRAVIGVASIVVLASLSGCSTLFLPNEGVPIVHRAENPNDGTNISAVTAGRRMTFTKNMKSDNVTCSEPPPDVAQSYAAALGLSGEKATDLTMSAVINNDKADMAASDKLKAAFNYGQATAQAQLGQKSQALLLFRQGAFTLCQAFSNNAINGDARRLVRKEAVASRIASKPITTVEPRPDDLKFAEDLGLSAKTTKRLFSNLKKSLDAGKRPDLAVKDAVDSEADNDDLTDTSYSQRFDALLNAVKEVMKDEIKEMYKNLPGAVIVNAPNVQIAAGSVTTGGDGAKSGSGTQTGDAPKAGTDGNKK